MTKITVDPVMFNKLNRLVEPLELCDPSGKILARVLPHCDPIENEPATPQVSEEELTRRSKTKAKGSTTAELLKRLEQQ